MHTQHSETVQILEADLGALWRDGSDDVVQDNV